MAAVFRDEGNSVKIADQPGFLNRKLLLPGWRPTQQLDDPCVPAAVARCQLCLIQAFAEGQAGQDWLRTGPVLAGGSAPY